VKVGQLKDVVFGRVSDSRLLVGLTPDDVVAALAGLRLRDRSAARAELRLAGERFGTVVTWTRTCPRVRWTRRSVRGTIAADLRRLGQAAYAARDLPNTR
jgi:hypothetical protein